MANVLFKRGLSTNLTTIAPVEGAFYLTTDTDKLYVGKRINEDEVKIVELNRCIISVDKASDIINPVVDQFYYIEEGNILAYWDGEKLNQINSTKDVADRVTAVEGKVKTVEDVLNGTDAEGEQGTEGYKPATNGLIKDVEDLKVAVGVGQDGEGSITDRVGNLEDIINGTPAEGNPEDPDYIPAVDGLVDRVENLEKAVEVINGEGEGSIKKAAEDATANAIAQLINDSEENPIDEKFDTLKEIADWILESDENAEALDAEKRIGVLEDAVGTPAKDASGVPGDDDYQPAEEATGLYKTIEEIVDNVQDVKDTINGLDATVSNAETDPIHVTITQVDGKLNNVTVNTDMFTWGEF